ncbi:hypothetical protein ACLB2K_075393 [Fragaria x ananassa]
MLEPIDVVRFGAVCKQWHTPAKTCLQTNPKRNHQKLLPLLIIPPPLESDEGNKTRRRIYSLSETKVYDNIHLKLPSYTERCCGSCHASHHKANGLYEYYVAKVVLSADPILSPDDYVVAVLCGVFAKLAFIKKGQTSRDDGDELYMKALVRRSWINDDHSNNNNNKAVAEGRILLPNRPFFFQSTRDYLVESTKGDLFLLRRMIWYDLPLYDDDMPITLETFQMCRVVLDQEDNNIVQHIPVRSIGDEAFFIGDNQPVSVLASNYPIEADCIYYTDDLTFKNFRPCGPDDTKPLRAEIGVFRLSNCV